MTIKPCTIFAIMIICMTSLQAEVIFEFQSNQASYMPGDTIELSVLAHNPGPQARTLQFKGDCEAGFYLDSHFSIYDSTRDCDQNLHGIEILPGETRTWNWDYDQTLEPGPHIVGGMLFLEWETQVFEPLVIHMGDSVEQTLHWGFFPPVDTLFIFGGDILPLLMFHVSTDATSPRKIYYDGGEGWAPLYFQVGNWYAPVYSSYFWIFSDSSDMSFEMYAAGEFDTTFYEQNVLTEMWYNGPHNLELVIDIDGVVDTLSQVVTQHLTGAIDPEVPNRPVTLEVFPNPFNASTTVGFELFEGREMLLNIYDLQGRLVDQIENAWLPAGHHKLTWDAGDHPSGVYIVEWVGGRERATRKVVLLR